MRYKGSKVKLLNFIDTVIQDFVNPKGDEIFCDLFSGTSSVGKHFKNKGFSVIANDLQGYGYIIAKHIIENNSNLEFIKLKEKGIEPFNYLNSLEGVEGEFIYENYSLKGTQNKKFQRMYYTDNNTKKIDAIRLKIEQWKNEELINDNEYYYLIVCLLDASDSVANTTTNYEGSLKQFTKTSIKDLIIKPKEIVTNVNSKYLKAYNKNANDLIREIKGDILYLDPPYNRRRYDTNYHLLETIALYDNPKLKDLKGGLRVEEEKQSKYCLVKYALKELEDLIENANFKYIVLSYNDEGIISVKDIETLMKKHGNYKRFETKYQRFKCTKNLNYKQDSTIEYLHCLEKTKFENTI